MKPNMCHCYKSKISILFVATLNREELLYHPHCRHRNQMMTELSPLFLGQCCFRFTLLDQSWWHYYNVKYSFVLSRRRSYFQFHIQSCHSWYFESNYDVSSSSGPEDVDVELHQGMVVVVRFLSLLLLQSSHGCL